MQAFAQAVQANPVAPTVTKEMGDVGGKIFGQPPDRAKTRHYYIAAEEDAWDFLPENRDPVCGKPLPPQLAAKHTAMKLRYFQYADATFTAKVLPTPSLGLLGPVLRGITGETLAVTFLNRTELPLSMHPHGVKYDKDSEGSHDRLRPGLGAAVGPGARFTYVWHLDEQSGPLPSEPSSKCWLYHSHVHGDAEANLGLIGSIIVTDPQRARPDGTPKDVDREMASLFMIFNESGYDEEAAEAAAAGEEPEKSLADLQAERELGFRYTINGSLFGNLPGLEMNEGERVRWYLFGLGDENDIHTAHWHGLRVIEEGRRRADVVELLPATMKVADMVADNPGSWLYHCHVAEHMQEGMFARVVVHPKNAVGASRAPESAFFGLKLAEQSLRIDRAEWDGDADAAKELRLRGIVMVPAAFRASSQLARVEVGESTAQFQLDENARAANAEGTFQASNADRFGFVYGEQMQFVVRLKGASLQEALKKAGALRHGTIDSTQSVPVKITIGDVAHSAKFFIR